MKHIFFNSHICSLREKVQEFCAVHYLTSFSFGTHQPGLLTSFLLSGFTARDSFALKRLCYGVIYGFGASSTQCHEDHL